MAKDHPTQTDDELDPLIDQLPSRYVVGIDLGTTNSAVTYIDTHEQPWQVRVLPLPQLVGPGEVESRESLPSFHYQPLAGQTRRISGGKARPVSSVAAVRLAPARSPIQSGIVSSASASNDSGLSSIRAILAYIRV